MSPPLTVETINVDSKDAQGVPNLKITVQVEDQGTQYDEVTDENGVIKFSKIKSTQFKILVAGEGKYFPIDSTVVLSTLKSPFTLEIEELKTIISGKVYEDSTHKGIDSCVIVTEPATSQAITNSFGEYVLKSKLITNTPYTFKAMHKGYLPGDIKSIKLNINEKNKVPLIELAKIQRGNIVDPTGENDYPNTRGAGTLLNRKKKND
jgi:hypothetical protein